MVCVKSYDFLVFLAANKMMIINHLETTTDLKRLILYLIIIIIMK